ncbi:glycosyl hydrolase family 65 central catalytic domain-containing protein [Dipodascopsis uninucleata]
MYPRTLITLLLLGFVFKPVFAGVSRLLKRQLAADISFSNDDLLNGSHYDPDNWVLSTTQFQKNKFQVQPYVSNGYIGIRLPVEGTGFAVDEPDSEDGSNASPDLEPTNGWPLFSPRFTGAYISGFWDLQPNTTETNFPELLERGGESVISTIPVWSSLLITAENGAKYDVGVNESDVKNYIQSLSLKNGIVVTSLDWYPNGDESEKLSIKYEVVAHRVIPTLGLVRLDITAEKNSTIKIADILDGEGSYRTIPLAKNYSSYDSSGMWTGVRPYGLRNVTAYEYSHLHFQDHEAVDFASRKPAEGVTNAGSTISQEFTVKLTAGKTFTAYKYVGVASSDAYNNPKRVAAYTAKVAASIGWKLAVLDHKVAWLELWDSSDIVVPGDLELQISVRASLFHLMSALRSGDEPAGRGDNSIAVSGLSADSYGGLIFWDADTWMHPSLSVLYPEYATNINNFRQRIHGQSIENAKSYNLSGAIYSWTSGRFGNCTGTGPCIDYEYHINVDIAQAHWNQYLLSNDTEWLKKQGWPIIKDAADMFASYVVKNDSTNGYYFTYNMTDPDEYANFINNGAFTNGGISKLMGWAGRAAEIIGEEPNSKWKDIEQNIFIPADEDVNLILEFTNMNGSVEIKQADVVMLTYPLEFERSWQESLNNLDFYAMAQSADGPAMTWAIFAIDAAQLSPAGCSSYTYMLYSSQPYLRAPFYQFSEQMDDNVTTNGGTHPAFPFLTGHGGFLQVFTHGFTGFRPREDAFYLDPVLPPQLEGGYSIKGMKWRGNIFDVTVQLDRTIIERQPSDSFPEYTEVEDLELSTYLSERKQRTIKRRSEQDDMPASVFIGSGEMEGIYALMPGDTLVVPTRRPDLNGTTIDGNQAQCVPAISNSTWVQGHFPISAVDGSNSTSWQPVTRDHSALFLDLGETKNVSGFSINWGRIPAKSMSIGYINSHKLKSAMYNMTTYDIDSLDFEWPISNYNVSISSAYNEADALKIKLTTGNTTTVPVNDTISTRYMMLVIEGSYDEVRRYGDVGATVAEFAVL